MHSLEIAAHWAWQTSLAASVLIAPALLAAILLRKAVFTPVRHALGLLVVARLLMPFAVPSPLSVFNWINAPSQPPITLPKIAPAPAVPTAVGSPQNRSFENKSPSRSQPELFFPILWVFGVAAILARVAWQHRRVRRWIATGEQLTNGPGAEALKSALLLSNCRRSLRIYSLRDLKTPALFGLFKPRILLPRELAEIGDFARLRLVCLHEIAHLRRRDVLINWFAIFAQALHWFNPFVWLTLRRLRADQELRCDADVMRVLHPDEHRAYGETLLALASPRSFTLSPLIPVSSNFKQIKERIAMIKQFKPVTHRLLLFGLPPLAAALAIVTFTAASEKKPAPVIPEKTAKAASATDPDRGMKILQRQTDIETKRVSELEQQVDELRKALQISYGDEADLHARTGETIKSIEADRIRAEQQYEMFARMLKRLKETKPAELRHVIPTAHPDDALNRLMDSLSKAQQQLAVLQKDYGPDHAEIIRLEALIKTLNQQIDSRVDGVLSGLEAMVASHQAIVVSLGRRKEEAIRADTEGLERARPYFRAKRELETHQKILGNLQTRLVQESVDREFQAH